LSFAPVWSAPIPQEVLSFMEDAAEAQEILGDDEAVAV
jgi:hypothetical protein